MKSKKLNKKGFTLIEVVLVLAIGGLIFLLAFLAFSQASKNRRDTARRADAGRFVSETQNYMGDNGSGNVAPTQAIFNSTIQTTYLGSPKAPDGNSYNFTTALAATNDVLYTPGAATTPPAGCTAGTTLGAGDYKVQIQLEKGIACRDSL